MKFLWGTQPWSASALSFLISNDLTACPVVVPGALSPWFTTGTVRTGPKGLGEVVGSAASPLFLAPGQTGM